MDVIEELKSFWENSHKKISGGGVGLGGDQGGCERRIEVFYKLKKKKKIGGGVRGWGWGGVRVDENEELNFL